jgi:hypothetical protein
MNGTVLPSSSSPTVAVTLLESIFKRPAILKCSRASLIIQYKKRKENYALKGNFSNDFLKRSEQNKPGNTRHKVISEKAWPLRDTEDFYSPLARWKISRNLKTQQQGETWHSSLTNL